MTQLVRTSFCVQGWVLERKVERALAKKLTSFVLYVDKVTQIQAIIESTGGDKAAQVFRDLIDEALGARRRKDVQQLVLPEDVPNVRLDEMLETIQTLLELASNCFRRYWLLLCPQIWPLGNSRNANFNKRR